MNTFMMRVVEVLDAGFHHDNPLEKREIKSPGDGWKKQKYDIFSMVMMKYC